ncbi:unnamed protein product [Meloidogyne enterolobii]|uniref:Uncharacterized protein n=1 Tax=Meloidogyne enterolobii TaxID=390850 RepID=A0ACB0ZPJ2_MELEN
MLLRALLTCMLTPSLFLVLHVCICILLMLRRADNPLNIFGKGEIATSHRI